MIKGEEIAKYFRASNYEDILLGKADYRKIDGSITGDKCYFVSNIYSIVFIDEHVLENFVDKWNSYKTTKDIINFFNIEHDYFNKQNKCYSLANEGFVEMPNVNGIFSESYRPLEDTRLLYKGNTGTYIVYRVKNSDDLMFIEENNDNLFSSFKPHATVENFKRNPVYFASEDFDIIKAAVMPALVLVDNKIEQEKIFEVIDILDS